MSDRIRRIIGLVMILLCILFCFIPVITHYTSKETAVYRMKTEDNWVLKSIPAEKNGKIRINQADADELTVLPGIGEKLAEQIMAERMNNGPFYYAEDLEAVKGIGSKSLQGYREMIDMTTEESGEQNGISCTLP